MTLRLSVWPMALWAVVLCAILSGCGVTAGAPGGSSSSVAAVSLSLTAPTDGAVVGVRTITVSGTVSPAQATVDVLGHRATVHKGTFTAQLQLARTVTAIPIQARATGFTPAREQVTVRYSPAIAVAMVIARRQAGPQAAPVAGGAVVPSARADALNVIDLTQPVTPAVTAAPAVTATPAAPKRTPAAPAPAPSPAPAPAPSSTPAPSGSPAPSSTPPGSGGGTHQSPLTPATIRALYLSECHQALGPKSVAYCGCMYGHLAAAGLLSSRHTIEAMNRRIEKFQRTHDLRVLPRALVLAQATCAGRLPPPNLSVGHLPALHHPAVPAPAAR